MPVPSPKQLAHLSDRGAAISDAIRRFDRDCGRIEYTDTDVAWELLKLAQGQLRRMSKALAQIEASPTDSAAARSAPNALR